MPELIFSLSLTLYHAVSIPFQIVEGRYRIENLNERSYDQCGRILHPVYYPMTLLRNTNTLANHGRPAIHTIPIRTGAAMSANTGKFHSIT
jgi:hypothetical protein